MDRKLDTSEFSFRDYLDLRLNPIFEELGRLRTAIEKMSVSSIELEYLQAKVKELSICNERLEDRLIKLEQSNTVSVWLFRFVAGVGTALLIAWLTGFLK